MELKLLDAGEIVNTHGLHGQVKINPWADGPGFLTGFSTYYLGGTAYQVENASVHKAWVLAKLRGVDCVEDAALLRGKIVQINRNVACLEEGAVFIADLVGLPVFADGEQIGTVAEILTRPANDVYVVKGGREYMIPAVKEFVQEVNVQEGFIRVKLIEGMATDEN